MRSPGAAFDLRAALTQELSAAIEEIDTPMPRPAAVHRCRVRLKRARALARVGKAGAPGLSAVFNDSARAVMMSLAPARELTALADTARSAAKEQTKKRHARALASAAEALEAERAALPRIDVEAACAGIRDLMALAQVWPEASPRQIRKGAKRVARKARAAFGEGRGADGLPPRHEWRKREKDRFFAVVLLDNAWPEKRRRHRGERVGDLLGKERDAMLLSDRIAATPGLVGTLKAAKRARGALAHRADRLGRRADRLGKRLHTEGA